MTARGCLIAVSGVDGSGKSTLVEALTRRLREHGRTVLSLPALKPRGASPVAWAQGVPRTGDGAALEGWIAGYFTLVLAANAAEVVAPALARGDWVVADRWALDHVANQRAFGNELTEWEGWLAALPRPDHHLLVDVPPGLAAERIARRGKDGGVGQGDTFLSRCRGHMLDLARHGAHGPVSVLDGAADPAVVLADAEAAVLGSRPRTRTEQTI